MKRKAIEEDEDPSFIENQKLTASSHRSHSLPETYCPLKVSNNGYETRPRNLASPEADTLEWLAVAF